MPTPKLCLRLVEIASASHARTPSSVIARNTSPLTNTAPSICGQVAPIAARPKATNAFSPM